MLVPRSGISNILSWALAISLSKLTLLAASMRSVDLSHVELEVFSTFHFDACGVTIALDRRLSVKANPCGLLLQIVLLHRLAAS